MVIRLLLKDENGAVTADWITLTAGIVMLGLMVAFSIMNSAGYLMNEFDDLNDRFATPDDVDPIASGGTAAASAAVRGPGPFTATAVRSATTEAAAAEVAAETEDEQTKARAKGLEHAASVAEGASQNGQQQSNGAADPGANIPR